MKKQTKSSTKFAMVRGPALTKPKYISPYGTPETLDHLRSCEAREWVRRYRAKIGELGAVNAQSWWEKVKSDIRRIRGQEGLDSLMRYIYLERQKKNESNN
jgi:hypothetical protein